VGGITTLFFDVGGVILTNGWDQTAREKAASHFEMNFAEFEQRHEGAVDAFEKGHLSIDDYIAQVVFDKPRGFTMAEFREFIYAQSKELKPAREFVDQLARSPKYFTACINNEGREVNEYRITKFGLARTFKLFLSSCYVGLRKPDPAIYRLALDVTRRAAAESIFVDDRVENLEGARRVGLQTIHYQNVSQLKEELRDLGVALPAATKAKAVSRASRRK
jgi:putative hydrolase of the HAD superfamily